MLTLKIINDNKLVDDDKHATTDDNNKCRHDVEHDIDYQQRIK